MDSSNRILGTAPFLDRLEGDLVGGVGRYGCEQCQFPAIVGSLLAYQHDSLPLLRSQQSVRGFRIFAIYIYAPISPRHGCDVLESALPQ